MRPVVLGDGRHVPASGTSKIDLHQVDRELLPYATHPTPGSADLCLITRHAAQADPGPPRRRRSARRGRPRAAHRCPRPDHQHLPARPDGNLIEISTYDGQVPTDT